MSPTTEVERLRALISAEYAKPIPATNVLFGCAEGLCKAAAALEFADDSDDLYEEARLIFHALAVRGYRPTHSLFAVANCHFHRGMALAIAISIAARRSPAPYDGSASRVCAWLCR